MALLTPKDIREHTFQTVRFKEGYDVDEVDDFLDQVTKPWRLWASRLLQVVSPRRHSALMSPR